MGVLRSALWRTALLPAGLTGFFCAGFAAVMHVAAPLLPSVPIIAISVVSGFLGSLFARAVLSPRDEPAGRDAASQR